MAHEIDFSNNRANMFYVGATPWHGLGVALNHPPTIDEGLRLAGLDWQVERKDLFFKENDQEISVNSKALVRNDTGKVLSVVSNNYTPLQNLASFKFFDKFLESGLCQLETAGSLYNGKKTFVLVKIISGDIEIVKGDRIEKYFLLSNGHDGKTCVSVGFTPIRVVCQNTLSASFRNAESKILRVWHGSQVEHNLESIKEIVNMTNKNFEATEEQYKFLASKQVNREDLKKFVEILRPSSYESASLERQKLADEKLTEKITGLFESGLGQELTGVEGTYWGLYNAVTQYLSYDIGRSQDRRLDSLWFGSNKTLNAEALEIATQCAKLA